MYTRYFGLHENAFSLPPDPRYLYMGRRYQEALAPMERSAELAPDNGEVFYDLAVIRLAAGKEQEALQALKTAVTLNPKLRKQALEDQDLAALRGKAEFEALLQ